MPSGWCHSLKLCCSRAWRTNWQTKKSTFWLPGGVQSPSPTRFGRVIEDLEQVHKPLTVGAWCLVLPPGVLKICNTPKIKTHSSVTPWSNFPEFLYNPAEISRQSLKISWKLYKGCDGVGHLYCKICLNFHFFGGPNPPPLHRWVSPLRCKKPQNHPRQNEIPRHASTIYSKLHWCLESLS